MIPRAFRLSDQQWEIFDLLARRAAVTPTQIAHAIYGDRLDCDVPPSARSVVKTQVSHLRARLAPIGMSIATDRRGAVTLYRFTPESRASARAMIRLRPESFGVPAFMRGVA